MGLTRDLSPEEAKAMHLTGLDYGVFYVVTSAEVAEGQAQRLKLYSHLLHKGMKLTVRQIREERTKQQITKSGDAAERLADLNQELDEARAKTATKQKDLSKMEQEWADMDAIYAT